MNKHVPWNKGKKMPEGFGEKISKILLERNQSGEDNPSWKGDQASYIAYHMWLRRKYGAASRCQNFEENVLNIECRQNAKTFHWALKKGKKYSRERDDYYQLCRSCHFRYDKINTDKHINRHEHLRKTQ